MLPNCRQTRTRATIHHAVLRLLRQAVHLHFHVITIIVCMVDVTTGGAAEDAGCIPASWYCSCTEPAQQWSIGAQVSHHPYHDKLLCADTAYINTTCLGRDPSVIQQGCEEHKGQKHVTHYCYRGRFCKDGRLQSNGSWLQMFSAQFADFQDDMYSHPHQPYPKLIAVLDMTAVLTTLIPARIAVIQNCAWRAL